MRELFVGKRGRIRTYIFELATAVAYPILGIAYFLEPANAALHSPVAQRVYPYDYVWSTGYVIAGVMILAGVLKPMLRLRVAGLLLLASALTMQCVAVVPTHFDIRELFNGVYALACWLRAALIIQVFRMYGSRPSAQPSAR